MPSIVSASSGRKLGRLFITRYQPWAPSCPLQSMPPRAEMVSVGVTPKTALHCGFPKIEIHTPEQQIGLVF